MDRVLIAEMTERLESYDKASGEAVEETIEDKDIEENR